MPPFQLAPRASHRALPTALLGVLLACSAGLASSDEGRWTSGGPEQGRAWSIAVDPTDSDTVYAATRLGLYRSRDGGRTWAATSDQPHPRVRTVIVDPVTPSTLYIHCSDGLLKSTDSGTTWTPVFAGSNLGPLMAYPDTRPLALLLVDWWDHPQRSLDGGLSWEALTWPPTREFHSAQLRGIALLPVESGVLYVALDRFSGPAVFRSEDGGVSWHECGGGDWRNVGAIAVHPAAPNRVYLEVHPESWYEGFIVRSLDGGQTWRNVTSGIEGSEVLLAIHPDDPLELYLETMSGLYRTADGGDTWEATGLFPDPNDIYAMAFDPRDGDVLYLSGETDPTGILRSGDRGLTWSAHTVGLPYASIVSLTTDSRDPQLLFAAGAMTFSGSDGVFRSRDGGRSWELLTILYGGAVAVDPFTAGVVYSLAGEAGVARSPDSGETWSVLPVIDYWGDPVEPQVVVADPHRAGTLHTISRSIFRSDDGGITWRQLTYIPSLDPPVLVVDPHTPGTLYIPHYAAVWRSRDWGDHWVKLDRGLELAEGHLSIHSLSADRLAEGVLYVATNVGVFVSRNAGETWSRPWLGVAPTLCDPQDHSCTNAWWVATGSSQPGVVYAITSWDLERSADFGVTWSATTWEGLPTGSGWYRVAINTLIVDGSRRRLLATSTSPGGVYSLDLGMVRSPDDRVP